MKRDNKKALYESIMTSVAKEVKKALNESNIITDINDIKKIISNWASENMDTTNSNWDNYDEYRKNLQDIIDYKKDILLDLVDKCYGDIIDDPNLYYNIYDFDAYDDLEIGLEEKQLKNIIKDILVKEAKYYYDNADPNDFVDDSYSYFNKDNEEKDEEDEDEIIRYGDIIDAVEGEDYQDIIDDEGNGIGNWILDRIMYPENGANVFDACVEIAQRLLDGENPDVLRKEIGDVEI